MRSLVFTVLFLASQAFADTITFTGSPCGPYRTCFPVETDNAALELDLSAVLNARPIVILNGVAFQGAEFDPGNLTITQTLTDPDGNTGDLIANFSHWVTRVNSGRAHYSIQHWFLDSGSFTVNFEPVVHESQSIQ